MTIPDPKTEAFRALHTPGDPLVLYNSWDAGSSQAVAKAGARAIATGSWSVAAAHGYEDGEALPLDIALENLARVVAAVDLPVTVDIEGGYGATPDAVVRTVERAIAAGAVGCNIEDSLPGSGALRDPAQQAERLRAARAAADRLSGGFFINARCDEFFQGAESGGADDVLRRALARASLYAEAGADGFFTPGVTDVALMARLAAASPMPLNIMADATTSLATVAEVGVARISFGPAPYLAAMAGLTRAATASFESLR